MRTRKAHTCIAYHLHIAILARIALNVMHTAVVHTQCSFPHHLLVSNELFISRLAATTRLAAHRMQPSGSVVINIRRLGIDPPHKRLCTIAVMQVNVQDNHAVNAVHLVRVCSSDSHVVDPTEAAGHRSTAVMTRWTCKDKRTSGRYVLCFTGHLRHVRSKCVVLRRGDGVHLGASERGILCTSNNTVNRHGAGS